MKIVVGYMDTPQGHAALDLAIEEAKTREASLVVVHSLYGGSHQDEAEIFESDTDLDDVSARLTAEGIEHQSHGFVRGNSPADDIVRAAKDNDASLIVIGLRRRSAVGKFLLGSNAHDILMDAPCPVLAVKPT